MIVVHHLDNSRSQRILWLLEELGEPYEITHHKRDPQTRLAPAALKQVHTLGKSPVIEDEGRMVAESGAIIDYILRRYGNRRLQPAASDPNYNDYVHRMHYAEGSAMPALIIRINVARVGDAASAMLPRLDAEIALHLTYINDALEDRQLHPRRRIDGCRHSAQLRWRTCGRPIWHRRVYQHRCLGEAVSGASCLSGGAGPRRRLQLCFVAPACPSA